MQLQCTQPAPETSNAVLCTLRSADLSLLDTSEVNLSLYRVAVKVSSGVLHSQVLGGSSPYVGVLLCGCTLTQHASTGMQ